VKRVCSNDNNDKDKSLLINILIHYLIENQSKLDRKAKTYSLRNEICELFYFTCRKLGLLSKRGRVNVALEGLMWDFIQSHADTPPLIQTTLFPPKQKTGKFEPNIAQKLEMKLVKRDLANILDALEQKRGHKDFLDSRLRDILPKAMRVYGDTRDKDIQKMLEKAEAWV